MLAEAIRLNKPNYRNRIGLSLRPDFLQATNMESQDEVYLIYDKEMVIMTKSLDIMRKLEEKEEKEEREKTKEHVYISV
jgi:hypothetical protein